LAGYDPATSGIEDLCPYLDNDVFKGVKIHPRNSNIPPQDETLFPLYEEIIKRGMVVNFDALGHSESLPLDEIRPTAFDRLAKKFPEMKIVLSHCGVPWVMEAFFTAKSNKNLHLDCSFIIDRYEGSSIERDLLYTAKHLDSKLIYGSDFPERSINRYFSLAKIAFTELPEEKKSKIFGGNAIKLYGLE
jgi:predicted TIM-barrel fold metal-dependent hydrolase